GSRSHAYDPRDDLGDERVAGGIQCLELGLGRRRAARQAEYVCEELRLGDGAEAAATVEAAAEAGRKRWQLVASAIGAASPRAPFSHANLFARLALLDTDS